MMPPNYVKPYLRRQKNDAADAEAKGTRERMALALLLFTGQRRGDVVGFGWQHISAICSA